MPEHTAVFPVMGPGCDAEVNTDTNVDADTVQPISLDIDTV